MGDSAVLQEIICLTLLIPGKDNRKNCDSTDTRRCQYGTKDIKYKVVPIWYKGYQRPGGANMTQKTLNAGGAGH